MRPLGKRHSIILHVALLLQAFLFVFRLLMAQNLSFHLYLAQKMCALLNTKTNRARLPEWKYYATLQADGGIYCFAFLDVVGFLFGWFSSLLLLLLLLRLFSATNEFKI